MDQGLEAYIKQCQSLGMAHADILAALKVAGWSDEQLAEFVASAQTSTPKTGPSRTKKVLIASTLSVIILLLPLGGVIYAAEQGYLPAVSRIYRKTALPLLWKSTNSNGPLSMGRVLAASAMGGTSQKASVTFDMTISSTTGAKTTSVLPGITKALHFADITPSVDCQFDDPSVTDCAPILDTPTAPDPTQYLPINASFTLDASSDGAGAFDGSLKIDTKKLTAANETYKAVIPTGVDAITLDFRTILSLKKYFLRSNLTAVEGEDPKWITGNVPDETTKAAQDGLAKPESLTTKMSDTDKNNLIDVAKKVVKDHGIERRNNKPYAHYELVLDRDTLKTLEKSQVFKDQHITVTQDTATYELSPTINLWVEPRTAHVGYMTIAMKSVDHEIRTDFSMTYSMQYGIPVNISAPDQKDINSQTLEEVIGGFFNTGSAL